MTRISFDDLVELMKTLRGPGGCPWDREQTFQTLKPFIIEESYEVLDAIDRGDRADLVEELGDFLLQAVFVAELAREEGSFDIDDAVRAIHDKLIRRHPHVFAGVEAHTAGEVIVNWEKLKRGEKKNENKGVLGGVPQALPALLKAGRLTEKASRIGFDWKRADDVFAKIDEELAELREAVSEGRREDIREELGDLLFTIANLARKLEVNAEESLQEANRKFIRRFAAVENAANDAGSPVETLTLEEMDVLWEKVKTAERA